jgi:outer membrane protein insertion porin family
MVNHLIYWCLFFLFSSIAMAQESGILVRKITIEGHKKIESDAIKAKIGSAEGMPFSVQQIKTDVQNLFSLGFFNDVEVLKEQKANQVDLVYRVKEKPTIVEINYVGNAEVKDDDIKEQVTIKPFEILNHSKIRETQEKLQKYFEEKGFLLAKIDPVIEDIVANETVKLTFQIEENEKVKVKKIRFLGNTKLKDSFLRNRMGTQEGGFFSFMSGSGAYKQDAFERDSQMLKYLYYNEGYVRANIEKPQVYVTPDKKGIYITIRVEEGEQYQVGDVDFSGDILFSRDELREIIKIDEKNVFAYETLQKDLSELQAKYGDLGYAFANVIPRTNIDDKTKKVDVTFEFDKGNKVYFGKINVVGNSRTRDKVVRRELKIVEGELYNETRKRESMENIQRLGFFEEVNFKNSTPAENPEQLNIDIVVKERHTGSIQLGAGYSSEDKFTMNGQLNESNFLGRGQRLGASLNHSVRVTDFRLNFTEPNYDDSDWLIGGDLYQNLSYRDDFDQKITGGAVRVGHPLGEYVEAILRYRNDRTVLTGHKDKDGKDLTDKSIFPLETASGVTSSITGTIEYDRRDDRFTPSKGLFLSTSLEKAGFGGDLEYIKSINTVRFFKKAFWEVVWRNNLVYGLIQSQSNKAPPFNEMFLLGGPFSLRGFPSASVGKQVQSKMLRNYYMEKKNYNSVDAEKASYRAFGGTRELYYMTELEFPLIAEAGIKGAVFFDIGQAEDHIVNNQFVSDVGFGFRWFSPIGPLRFEWGFPLNPDPSRHPPMNFEFMIGQPF